MERQVLQQKAGQGSTMLQREKVNFEEMQVILQNARLQNEL
jgi:hypothetical protein